MSPTVTASDSFFSLVPPHSGQGVCDMQASYSLRIASGVSA